VTTFFEVRRESCQIPNTDEIHSYVWATELRTNGGYNLIYRVILQACFITIGPFTIITLMTIRMIYIVRQANISRSRMAKGANWYYQ
jgi:hypothetical protein